MKKLFFPLLTTVVLFGLSTPFFAQAAPSYVKGYTKSNGAYVQGYYRTIPNSTKFDNYSTRGNYNPYTGNIGTVNPYKYAVPKYSAPTYKLPSYKTPSYGAPSYKSHKW